MKTNSEHFYEIIEETFRNNGVNKRLLNDMLAYSEKPFVTFLIHAFYKDVRPQRVSVTDAIQTFAEVMELSEASVHYAYFRGTNVPLDTLRRGSDYFRVRRVIDEEYGRNGFYDTLFPFFYKTFRHLALCVLATEVDEKGAYVNSATELSRDFDVSRCTIYRKRDGKID